MKLGPVGSVQESVMMVRWNLTSQAYIYTFPAPILSSREIRRGSPRQGGSFVELLLAGYIGCHPPYEEAKFLS